MASHDKHNFSSPEDGLPLMEKSRQWAHNDAVAAKREDGRRRHPAVRLFLAFLICSTVLFGLASVHSPSFRQRFSCHGMMGNIKPAVELEGEAQSSRLKAMMEKEAPQTPNDSVDISLSNQLEENHQEGGDSYHAAPALKTTKLQLLRRETNSSSVAPESSATAKTADPDPTATPTASSSEPSSTAEPPTSSASPTPSSPASSTFKTSTTTPTTSPQTSTTKAPEPTTSSSTPEPPNTGVNVTPSKTSSVESTSSVTSSSSTSSRGQATPTTPSVDDEDGDNGDGDDVTRDTTIYTTRPANPTVPPPTTPKVIIETSTRTSNGEVVIVESTITVQPSITQPVSVTDPARPPASLQNSAMRQEGDVMVLAGLLVAGAIGVLMY